MTSIANASLAQAHWIRRPATVYLLISVLVFASYPLLPQRARDVGFLFVAWGALLPIATGLRLAPPGARAPWVLLALGVFVGDITSLARRWPAFGALMSDAIPTLDALANALALAAALAIVARRGRNDIGGLIDTTIISIAVGGLLWSVVLAPNLLPARQEPGARFSLFITMLVLSGTLGALSRLAQNGRHLRPLWFLLAALTFNLGGMVLVSVTAEPVWQTAARMMFLAAYIMVAAFALDPGAPAMMRLGAPPVDAFSVSRLSFLGAAVAVIPVLAGARALTGADVDGLFLVVGGAATAFLTMARIGLLAAERNRAEAALRHEACHDPLTGLLNRRAFVDRLAEELTKPHDCVLLFCDLDGFKAVNDRYGHEVGDRLLVTLTQRMTGCVGEKGLVGRFGGDEFLMLFRSDNAEEVQRLCAQVRDSLTRPCTVDTATTLSVGVSIGATVSEGAQRAGCDADELISKADKAMYEAKQRLGVVRTVATSVAAPATPSAPAFPPV